MNGTDQEKDIHQATQVECRQNCLDKIAGCCKYEIRNTILEEQSTDSTLKENGRDQFVVVGK